MTGDPLKQPNFCTYLSIEIATLDTNLFAIDMQSNSLGGIEFNPLSGCGRQFRGRKRSLPHMFAIGIPHGGAVGFRWENFRAGANMGGWGYNSCCGKFQGDGDAEY